MHDPAGRALTLAIAIAGLVIAALSVGSQLYVLFRDRPKLTVGTDVPLSRGGPYVLAIVVSNRGSRPTTIVEVGFEVTGSRVHINIDETGDCPAIPIIKLSGATSAQLLQPGETARFTKEPTVAMYPIDSPLRPYVFDSHGRVTWGRAHPFFRWFYDAGWRPVNDGTSLTERSDRPLYVAPIFPVWQVWKKKPLRGSWRRRQDYSLQRWRRRAMRITLTEHDFPPAGDATDNNA